MAEHQVLVVLDAALAVEVDVEQLARPQCLRDAVGEVQAGHLFVAGLRVQADDVTVLELGDEGQAMAHRGQEDIAAGFVGLRLKGDPHAVALVLDVARGGIHALLHAVQRCRRGPWSRRTRCLRARPT